MLNHYTWFLAEAHQARLTNKSSLKDIGNDMADGAFKNFQSTSKSNTQSTIATHIKHASTHVKTFIKHITNIHHAHPILIKPTSSA